jgi:hypothetical protein
MVFGSVWLCDFVPMFTEILTTVSRIVIEHAQLIAPAVVLALLLIVQQVFGRWPDLWRLRRAVLPIVDQLADGDYDDELDVVDERVGVDLAAAADALPEKTGVPLQAREFVGTIDAPPATVREELRAMERVYPNTLASIQYVVDEATRERIYEVGSYAFRPGGFLSLRQVHVRLTASNNGSQTALWAHEEFSAWRRPVAHYAGKTWSAERGVRHVASVYAHDARYAPSDAAVAATRDETASSD